MSERERNPEITRRLQSVLEPHRMADSLVNDDSSFPDGACVVKINGVEIPTYPHDRTRESFG